MNWDEGPNPGGSSPFYVPLPGILNLQVADQTQVFVLPGNANPDEFIRNSDGRVQLLIQTIQTSGPPNIRTQLDVVNFDFE
jgi:hypothetical protein